MTPAGAPRRDRCDRNEIVAIATIALAVAAGGCGAVIEPGHRGLLFDARHGGLQHDVLEPGWHRVGPWGRIDDFDVTYQTRKEDLPVRAANGARALVSLSIIYRPIVAELCELDTEIGPNYFEEVVRPEFRTAIRSVFARHPLTPAADHIEDEIGEEVRRRVQTRHVEISSVTLESVVYVPDPDLVPRARLEAELRRLCDAPGGVEKP